MFNQIMGRSNLENIEAKRSDLAKEKLFSGLKDLIFVNKTFGNLAKTQIKTTLEYVANEENMKSNGQMKTQGKDSEDESGDLDENEASELQSLSAASQHKMSKIDDQLSSI